MKLSIAEEVLTDGSKVYNLVVFTGEKFSNLLILPCVSKEDADELAFTMNDAINKHTVVVCSISF
jgi:hypothetical protein